MEKYVTKSNNCFANYMLKPKLLIFFWSLSYKNKGYDIIVKKKKHVFPFLKKNISTLSTNLSDNRIRENENRVDGFILSPSINVSLFLW